MRGRGAGAGFHHRAGDPHAAPAGNDHPVGAAQQRRAQDGAQVVGVLHPVTEHQEGRLTLGAGRRQQVLQGGILDLAGPGCHALVFGADAAELLQLVAGDLLHQQSSAACQGRVVARRVAGQAVRQVDGVHRAAALQQFGHGVLAPDQGIGMFFALGAGMMFACKMFHAVPPPALCGPGLWGRLRQTASGRRAGPEIYGNSIPYFVVLCYTVRSMENHIPSASFWGILPECLPGQAVYTLRRGQPRFPHVENPVENVDNSAWYAGFSPLPGGLFPPGFPQAVENIST